MARARVWNTRLNDTTVAAIVRGLIAEYLDDEELRTRINLRYPRR